MGNICIDNAYLCLPVKLLTNTMIVLSFWGREMIIVSRLNAFWGSKSLNRHLFALNFVHFGETMQFLAISDDFQHLDNIEHI